MLYRNQTTGAVLTSDDEINGGDWIKVSPEIAPEEKNAPKKKTIKKGVKNA